MGNNIKKKKKCSECHEYFYQLPRSFCTEVRSLPHFNIFSKACMYIFSLMHLCSNLDFDWHINDADYFTFFIKNNEVYILQ